MKAFELMFRQSFEQAPERGEVSEVTIRAIVTGIRRVVYRCLREGRPAELQDHRGAAGVGVGHQRPGGTPRMELSRLVPTTPELAPAEPESMTVLSWEERPDSLRSRAELAQRERIVRAAAKVVVEQGYEALSIPAISGAAGVSNQTFYEHFANKGEAFVAAFDALAGQALRATAAASAEQEDWVAAVSAGIRGLLEFIASNRVFARLAFFELPTAGADALDHADATTRRFTSFLEPNALPGDLGATVPPMVIEAIGGGMLAVIQHEIAHGKPAALREKTAEVAWIALAPLGRE